MKEIRVIRRRLLRRLKAEVEPLLYDSGYVRPLDRSKGLFGPTRPYRLYAFQDANENVDPIVLRGGMAIQECYAITEDGVITDAYGHGAVTTYWRSVPVEDIEKLLKVVLKLKATPAAST